MLPTHLGHGLGNSPKISETFVSARIFQQWNEIEWACFFEIAEKNEMSFIWLRNLVVLGNFFLSLHIADSMFVLFPRQAPANNTNTCHMDGAPMRYLWPWHMWKWMRCGVRWAANISKTDSFRLEKYALKKQGLQFIHLKFNNSPLNSSPSNFPSCFMGNSLLNGV